MPVLPPGWLFRVYYTGAHTGSPGPVDYDDDWKFEFDGPALHLRLVPKKWDLWFAPSEWHTIVTYKPAESPPEQFWLPDPGDPPFPPRFH